MKRKSFQQHRITARTLLRIKFGITIPTFLVASSRFTLNPAVRMNRIHNHDVCHSCWIRRLFLVTSLNQSMRDISEEAFAPTRFFFGRKGLKLLTVNEFIIVDDDDVQRKIISGLQLFVGTNKIFPFLLLPVCSLNIHGSRLPTWLGLWSHFRS
jgi:hypothetical protein